MRSKILKWLEVLLTAAVSIGLSITLLLLLHAAGDPLWSQEAAGWAQTIGTVGAIVAGFAVANRQAKDAARLARRDRMDADADRLTAALAVARYGSDLVEEAVREATETASVLGYLIEGAHYYDFSGAVKALESVQLHELRSREMIDGLLKLRRCLERVDWITKIGQEDELFENRDFYEWRDAMLEVNLSRASAMQMVSDEVERGRVLLREHS